MTELLTDPLSHISTLIGAAGALGTAAFGLVDASKFFRGGISNPGFGYIEDAVTPYIDSWNGPLGETEILRTLRANWLNGVAKSDQKAVAKSLIRLGLIPANANRLADLTGTDRVALATAAQKIVDGQPLLQPDLNVLGRFDAIVSATLDCGYERADQLYRNSAKIAASAVAVALAVWGAWMLNATGTPFTSTELLTGILVGAVATPLAPIAKDLTTTLSAAVKAVSAARR